MTSSRKRGSLFRSRVKRSTAVVIVIGAAALGVLVGWAINHHASGSSGSHQLSEFRGAAIWPPGRRPAPNFTLPDQSGRRIELSALRGRAVILTFMDSRCHQECPLEGRALAVGLRQVPAAERPLIVVVSVDPWADTPGSAVRAMRRFGLAAYDWRWLLAPRRRLEGVWRKFRIEVRRSSKDIEHTDALYLIDARGFERAGMVYPFLPTWVSADLDALAREG